MNVQRPFVTLLFACVLIFPVLVSCAGSGGKPTNYYVLSPVDKEQAHGADLSIVISRVHIPQYLERPQIVSRRGENNLFFSEQNQWAGSLRKDIKRTLAVNLSRKTGSAKVYEAPHLAATTTDFQIALEILQFERVVDGRVIVSIQWQVSRGSNGEHIDAQISDHSSEEVVAESDYQTMVSVMSDLLGKTSDTIAEVIISKTKNE